MIAAEGDNARWQRSEVERQAVPSGFVVEQQGLQSKRIATLKARAALVDVVLLVADDDRGAPLFSASRWGLTKALHSVEEVDAFLRQVGGPKA